MSNTQRESVAVQTERITRDLVEKYRPVVHDILMRGFYPYESICNGFYVSQDLEAQAQLNLLIDKTLLDGVSILVRRADDNEIIGVVVNKIQEKGQPGEESFFERFTSENITNPSAKLLVEFMCDADAKVDLFGEMKVDRLIEVTFLCVLREASGAGAGKALVAATEVLARDLGITALSALFTASPSQAIGKAAGFRVFDIYHHSECLVNGVPITDHLRDDQQFTQICGKVLT